MDETLESDVILTLNKFELIINDLKNLKTEDPLDYLKNLVNYLKKDKNSKTGFDDHTHLIKFIEEFHNIKIFFDKKNHEKIKNSKIYLDLIKIPESKEIELLKLAKAKKKLETNFNSINIDEIVLKEDNYNEITEEFSNFRKSYSKIYIEKHFNKNSIISNFGKHILVSTKFNLLSKLSSIDQINCELVILPETLKNKILSKQKEKCGINKKTLNKKLEKYPVCQECEIKLEDYLNQEIIEDLSKYETLIIKNLDKNLFTAIKKINTKSEKINEILAKNPYQTKKNLIEFFMIIFEVFKMEKKNSERVNYINSIIDKLYNDLYSDDALIVIEMAFQEEPIIITISIISDIIKNMDSKIYTEKEMKEEFNKKTELIMQNKKKEKYESLGLKASDDKPHIVFRFKKIKR